MKFDRMRMEKEEEIQKQTKVLNAGAVNKKGDCTWTSGCLTQALQLGNSWQWYQHKESRRRNMQKATRDTKNEKNVTPFFKTVSAITVQEEEYKNGDVLSKY